MAGSFLFVCLMFNYLSINLFIYLAAARSCCINELLVSACGILVAKLGSEPGFPALEAQSQPLDSQGSPNRF